MNESVLGKLAGRLAANEGALCAWVTVSEPAVAEWLAREAFDAVALDLQHGAIDLDGAIRSILSVALAGKPTIVRVPVGAFALASQLLDAGASGILAPMINSGDDARRLVEFVKFPALGALDDILRVEGVDGVFVGPSDLSIALSGGVSVEPRGAALMIEARRVAERAEAHGKYAAMFCFDGADAHAMLALGYRVCTIASDQALIRAAARGELAAARAGRA